MQDIRVAALPDGSPFRRVFREIVDKIGRIGGPDLLDVLSLTATLNFPSVAAGATQTLTATLTGAVAGDPVVVGAPIAVGAADLIASGYVSADDTISVVLFNATGGAVNPASASYKITCFHYA